MSSRLRVFVLIVVLVALGAVGLAAVRHASRPVGVSTSHHLLVFDVPADVEEAPPTAVPFSLSAFRRDRPSLLEYTDAIRRAAHDDDIRGLVLHVDGVAWGWARLAELREAIGEFRAAGKRVDVSLSGGGEQEYLLASAGDRIAMPPTSTLQLDGLSMSVMFLKGAYDKLGITPNFAHHGQYKSAVEQYTRTDLSPAARVAMNALLDDTFTLLVDTLANARRLAADTLRARIDDGPYTASAARAAGLIDTLLDSPDLDSLAARRGGRTLATLTLDHYLERDPGLDSGTEMALVVASGEIVPGRSRETPFGGAVCGSETIVNALRDARRRPSIKAVILRVDSPGGSGEASDDIWREVERVRRTKPVVVSMSNLAASGGYYVACGADAIVAEPGTITGSIGVFGGKLNLLGLYHKLGLNIETISRGRHAEMMSPFRDFTPEEADRFQAQMDDFYRTFLARVAAGRRMTPAQVDSIGQGRVWSGRSAIGIGLVDSLGGMNVAIALARRHAGLSADADVSLQQFPRARRAYFRHFLDGLLDDDDASSGTRALLAPVLRAWSAAAEFPAGRALALMPYRIEIR